MRTIWTVLLVVALGAGAACRRPPAPTPDVVAVATATLPGDPLDRAWQAAPEHVAALLLQDLVEPRLMTPSTAAVRVRALVSGDEIALRLEWADVEADDRPGPGQFPDGCAVQFPQKAAASAPDPQMGQLGQGVDITFWRADWQATVNGRGDTIQELYPNATVDHYPFDARSLERGSDAQRDMATRYAPAVGAGNVRGAWRTSAVEDLVAEGPGTLSPAATTVSRGGGVRTADGWAVVIVRPRPEGLSLQAPATVAFAVWQGGAGEAGARKMRTGWVPLSMREAP
ncbi:MAG: ethylbenzene dehydrogenase-related protein [Vicinamibacterales bacterium]|nr:ethylbenzene dehydrogenase-related protein [Vicinamibacterales bacterium]